MDDTIIQILQYIAEIIAYSIVSFIGAWYYFVYKRKALPGKLIGAWIIGFIGAVLITLLSGSWFIPLVNWLMSPKFGESFFVRVNLITAFIGAFGILWLYNYVNHDRERRD
ncbi:MAG: hypothetical protein NZ853_04780 [Leptospiraceae bacterium]|nr:hypothetical protein [Leptospiraceae bacterium]MDW7975913.1 hypothetical protein [Leptospiraceae bacterium]